MELLSVVCVCVCLGVAAYCKSLTKKTQPPVEIKEQPTVEVEIQPPLESKPEVELKQETVMPELPKTVGRDYEVEQLKVLVGDLRFRTEPSTKGEVVGYAEKNKYYSFSEVTKKDAEGIVWYHVGDCYIGDSGAGDLAVCKKGECMIYPVNYVGITTVFSKSHPAIDFGFSSKNGGMTQAIVAPCDMKITKTGTGSVIGKYIIAHATYEGKKYTFRFIHLSKIDVSAGDTVKCGTKIGNMGNTGSSSNGYHLHFDIWKGHTGDMASSSKRYDVSVNPLTICRLAEGQKVGDETDKKNKILRK